MPLSTSYESRLLVAQPHISPSKINCIECTTLHKLITDIWTDIQIHTPIALLCN